MVNRIPVPVIKETEILKKETSPGMLSPEIVTEDSESHMLTPVSTPGRRRSSAMSQIAVDLLSRSQKVELLCL